MNTKDSVRVVIDIDDTIIDLLGAWCKWLNDKYDLNIQPEDVKEWDMKKTFYMLSDKQIYKPLNDSVFWKTVEPKAGSAEYINRLIDYGYDVYLCTATSYKNVWTKYVDIIQRYFPFITWDKVIITSNKQMVRCDVMIDDGVHNLIGADCCRILMDAPHNRDCDIEKHELYRFNNWKDIYEFIVMTYI